MSRYDSLCSLCDHALPDDADRCPDHPLSGTYMVQSEPHDGATPQIRAPLTPSEDAATRKDAECGAATSCGSVSRCPDAPPPHYRHRRAGTACVYCLEVFPEDMQPHCHVYVDGWCEFHDGFYACAEEAEGKRLVELQDGASDRHAEGSNLGLPPGRLAGAPSCDSAELAAIRARLGAAPWHVAAEDGHALLRMVDNLMASFAVAIKVSFDLRKELAAAVKKTEESEVIAGRRRERAETTEAKLTTAEADNAELRLRLDAAQQRILELQAETAKRREETP